MVEERITDGYRIAELLASEVDGRRDGPLGRLAVANPDRSVEGTAAGERAYDVRRLAGDRDPRREPTGEDAGALLAQLLVHLEGASLAVFEGRAAAERTADDVGLEADPSAELPAVDTDDALAVRLEKAADVKRAADVLAAASDALVEDAE